jgi:site-specific recombinase
MVQSLGAAFLTINIILIGGGVILVVLFVVAIWRAMKAHESIAESLRVIAAAQSTDKTAEEEIPRY